MNLYKWLEIWVIIITFIVYKFRIKGKVYTSKVELDPSKKSFFIWLTAIPIILVTGLRHNMGTDYLNYQYIYEYEIKQKSISEILKKNQEVGFALFQKIVGELSNYNTVILMTVIAVITVVCYYYMFYRYSESLWLSVLLLLIVGSYVTSFNTTRQFMACALFFAASVFILKEKPVLFFISVLGISLIHTSALVMIPLYFLLNINWKSKKEVIILAVLVLVGIYVLLNMGFLVRIAQKVIYASYQDKWQSAEGLKGFGTLVRPIFFSFLLVFNLKDVDWNNRQERVQCNAIIFFVVSYVAAYSVYIMYRFSYYFLPFILIGIPNMIQKSSKTKRKWNYAFTILFLLIYFIFGQANLEYYLFWQRR